MRVTFASMIQTDGTRTAIGIYRGNLIGPSGRRHIKFNSTTEHIATEWTYGGDHCEHVKRLSEKYATPAAPAVDWSL